MMKTLGPVAPCGSAAIDGVNLYYTSAHMHSLLSPFSCMYAHVQMHTCAMHTNAHVHTHGK